MTIQLRNYQTEAVNHVRAALRRYDAVLLQSPTGSGKTAIATHIHDSARKKDNVSFFICHRKELLDQTSQTFKKFGIDHGFIASGMDYDRKQKVQICSIDTLKNRLDKIAPPALCVWDEAHHLKAAGWSKTFDFFSKAKHVGLSATPQRGDGKGLDDKFQYMVPGPSVEWLIEQGFLAKYRLFSIPGVDLTGVHSRMGDFIKKESQAAMQKPTITGNIIGHWQKYASDRLTIGFAVSVDHSQFICEQFRKAGIMAMHLDGTTPKNVRRDVLAAFAAGEIRVVFNVGLFAEGFDIAANSGNPDVVVGAVIDAAPTQSLGMWLQRCGRALRPQGEAAIILDHSGNALRHGMPDEEREWKLTGREVSSRGKQDDEADIGCRQCPECFAVHKPDPICPECGHKYVIQARKIETQEGELQELTKEQMQKIRKQEVYKARDLEDLVEIGIQRGYKSPEKWAAHIFTARQQKQQRARY